MQKYCNYFLLCNFNFHSFLSHAFSYSKILILSLIYRLTDARANTHTHN